MSQLHAPANLHEIKLHVINMMSDRLDGMCDRSHYY